ncbi:MAG: hypothetical protein M1813_009668 [Trichoglossum hirsutum]|nr:MAG: hypothetical protein M1813_009668 [Trichoglossum hirsutum]
MARDRRKDTLPFSKEHQLNHELDSDFALDHLPGHPRVKLDDHRGVGNFLEREFCCADLETMAPRLWMMSKQDSASISALHRQRVKNRDIVITEDPRLHLVWIYDRIFIKPLPKYLTSRAFWDRYLLTANAALDDARRDRVRRAALGYLRTYLHLVRYESDLDMAQRAEARLVPADITWASFCDFTSRLSQVADADVSERYSYGEIRLTRLNFYAKFFLRRRQYHRIDPQYAAYFARFYGPVVFVFGILSVILSGMQVEMAVEQVQGFDRAWEPFRAIGRWFSVMAMISAVVFALVLAWMLVYKIAKEWEFALKDRRRKKKDERLVRDLARHVLPGHDTNALAAEPKGVV